MYHDCRSSPFYERIMLLRFFHRRQQENGIVNYFRWFSALIHMSTVCESEKSRFFKAEEKKSPRFLIGNSFEEEF